ncbi:hypothetical protein N7486_005847 [Penicillium sp. IBT 16267x]|nr:hypothetical protein N7486_005847 [Penicillium sp. IBT 16267x]
MTAAWVSKKAITYFHRPHCEYNGPDVTCGVGWLGVNDADPGSCQPRTIDGVPLPKFTRGQTIFWNRAKLGLINLSLLAIGLFKYGNLGTHTTLCDGMSKLATVADGLKVVHVLSQLVFIELKE